MGSTTLEEIVFSATSVVCVMQNLAAVKVGNGDPETRNPAKENLPLSCDQPPSSLTFTLTYLC